MESAETSADKMSESAEFVSAGAKRAAVDMIVPNEAEGSNVPESGSEDEPRRKRTRAHDQSASGSGSEFDEGEAEVQTPSGSSSRGSPLDGEAEAGHNGWNSGVNHGLRLSFGNKIQDKPDEPALDSRPESIAEESVHQEDEEAKGTTEPSAGRPVIIPKHDPPSGWWKLKEKEKILYLQRYFPGIDPDADFCVMCMSHRHSAQDCPDLRHEEEPVPTVRPLKREWCTICRQHYHSDVNLWRTYEPDRRQIRKVKYSPLYCAHCCSDSHGGEDCPAVRARDECTLRRDGIWRTWTRWNHELYVDPEAQQEPIVSEIVTNPDQSNGRPNFGPGKSIVPRRHVVFEVGDDDDENETFVRPLVKGKPKPGKIKIAGGIAGTNNPDSNGKIFPPLPPGPPPQLPAKTPGRKPTNNKKKKAGKPSKRKPYSRPQPS